MTFDGLAKVDIERSNSGVWSAMGFSVFLLFALLVFV